MRKGRFLRTLLVSTVGLCLWLVLSWLPVLLQPPAALASSFVIGSDPVDGSTISTPPPRVRIFFNTPISSASSGIVYFGIHYQVMNAGRSYVATNNPQELDTPLVAQLPQGSYTVRWTALSTTDGHATHGVIGFNIGHSSTGLSGQIILGPSTSNILPQLSLQAILAVAWDWLVMAALTLWIGILVIELIVLAGRKHDNGRNTVGHQDVSRGRTTRDLGEHGEGVQSDMDRSRGQIEVADLGDQGRIGASPIPTFMTKVRKHSLPLQWLCLAALLSGEIISFILRAALLTQTSNSNGIDPTTIRELIVDTTYGHLWLIRIALIGAALLFLWWTTRTLRRHSTGIHNAVLIKTRDEVSYRFAWLTLAGFILLTLALSEDITQLAQAHISAVILDWLFLAAQGIWFGGAAYLGFVLLPLLPAIEPELHSRSLVTLLQRYTPWIFGSSAVLLVCGLFLAETSLGSVQELITDPFGRALLVKIILIVMMLFLSVYALLFLGPKLRRQVIFLPVVNASMPARRSRQSALERNEHRLVVTMKFLAYLGAGALLCAAFMSFFAPPIAFPAFDNTSSANGANTSTTPSTANNQIIQTQQVGNLAVNLRVILARVDSDNTVIVTITDNNSRSVTDAQVHISVNMVSMNMGVARATIKNGNPTYKAVFKKYEAFSMSGLWDVALKIQRPNQAPVQVAFQVMLTG